MGGMVLVKRVNIQLHGAIQRS